VSAIERLLGPSPRVRLSEALLRLGDLNFSRADLAREAGLFRASTNRILKDFEIEGIVSRVSDGMRPVFKANPDSPHLTLLARFTTALELVELTSPSAGKPLPVTHATIIADFARSIASIKGAWNLGGSGLAQEGSPLKLTSMPSPSQNAIVACA
jgi:hypothetical protein